MTIPKTSVKLSFPLECFLQINSLKDRMQHKSCVTKLMVAVSKIKADPTLHSQKINRDQEHQDLLPLRWVPKTSWITLQGLLTKRKRRNRDSKETLMNWGATFRFRCKNLKNKSDFRRISQERVKNDSYRIKPKSVSEMWDIMRSAQLLPLLGSEQRI